MKKLLLALGLFLVPSLASAQCVGVGGINNVPVPGLVCPEDSTATAYAATGVGIVPAAAPTDIACLTGSATKTIRAKHVEVSGTAGTAINIVTILKKNATADSGGTPATTTALPVPYALDTSNAAASATTIAYTANPTINDAAPGVVGAKTLFLPATGTATAAGPVVWNFGDTNGLQPIVLRGVAQQLCISLGGVTTPSSGLMTVSFTWSEQAQ